MKLWAVLAVTLTVGVTLTTAQDYDDWIRSVQTLGSSMQFTCENAPVHPKDSSFVANATATRWLLPNYKFIDANDTMGRVMISADGTNLTITNIQKEDFGIYYCLMRTYDDELRMVKWGLNMKGPYFEDLWEKYRTNVIIGLSAFFGFLAIAFLIIIVYRFRWQTPVEPQKDLGEMSAAAPSAAASSTAIGMMSSSKVSPEPVMDMKPTVSDMGIVESAMAPRPKYLPPLHPAVEVSHGAYANAAATQDDGTVVNTTPL